MAAGMIQYKLVILGNVGVGKTALTIQLYLNHFIEKYEPTIEDSYRKQVTIDRQSCIVEILDTSGQEEYISLRDQWIRGGQGFVLVYSTSSRESFTQIREYYDRIQRVKELLAPSSPYYVLPTPVILVGNKSDKVTEREVSTQEGHALARKLGCEFVETSAKSKNNVEKAFHDIVRLLRSQYRQSAQQLPKPIGTDKGGKKCVIL